MRTAALIAILVSTSMNCTNKNTHFKSHVEVASGESYTFCCEKHAGLSGTVEMGRASYFCPKDAPVSACTRE